MTKRDIPYYQDYISAELLNALLKQSKPVPGVADLCDIGPRGGLESPAALNFLCELYNLTKIQLNKVLHQRILDRQFIDQRTRACYQLNQSLKVDFLDPAYETIIGQEDAQGRIVMGPKNAFYCRRGGGKSIAPLPKYLEGPHVTLFGPPDDAKLCINAMNAFHRKMKNEPEIVGKILSKVTTSPKWGADDEDSKTPLRADLIRAGENLTACFESDLSFTDLVSNKKYELKKEHLALPIKRFPGLALPCLFLFYKENPLPLHLYDFGLHLFKNWHNREALSFYVPKLETEEEAQYIHWMIETAEGLLHKLHPEYKLGSIRLFIVLENPRAIFRVNEIMDALHPYFAGASLGWHDYLASTARVFKEDANYRIPVKADPHIVIKYIKASHDLLSEVVGSRGGIKIGGMYGVLPMDNELSSPSFQITIKGFIKDVITQLKRDLSGFWVAHPDFIRIALALVEAWKDQSQLESLVKSLLIPSHHQEILDFIRGPDLVGLDIENSLYSRYLIVADNKESPYIASNHPEEIRYNVFQSLQYLTDWLSGNGCVALPAQIENVPVRVMDDLATAERSRWEVWHEIHQGRFPVEEFLKICHEEMTFIRRNLSDEKKIVQVRWDERTEKWYPIAMKLMIQLMTDKNPVEFATELLMPFTVETVRQSSDPWSTLTQIEGEKYKLDPSLERFNFYFSICGNLSFAKTMAQSATADLKLAKGLISNFDWNQVREAAFFHGDIGESKKTLDSLASKEQALVSSNIEELKSVSAIYQKKFGIKFLVSAQGKSGDEILLLLKNRLNNTPAQELENARRALWEICEKRLSSQTDRNFENKIEALRLKHKVHGSMLSISSDKENIETLCFGDGVNKNTWFELASLSKTLATCFSMEYFRDKKIPLTTSVNLLFEKTASPFRLKSENLGWANEVNLEHLLSHSALNMHYVNGVPSTESLPNVKDLLSGNKTYGYPPVEVINKPGTVFQYSGGGFLVLEHLIECLEGGRIQEIAQPFLSQLGLQNLSFEQKTLPQHHYATGYTSDGHPVVSGRKMFPAFAAGAMGTSADFSLFLRHLAKAYRDTSGSGPISHDTAVKMLFGSDKSSLQFMGAKMGLGVFIAEAGSNCLALHQGANDGFRCLFLHCFEGPDCNKGFVLLCNGDLNGVLFIAEVAQLLLSELKFSGVNTALFQSVFDAGKIPAEEIVNIAYKNLVFRAFEPDLPEKILTPGPLDLYSASNLAVGGRILQVSSQRFARAENLLSPHLPVFDPELYGRQGKIMDSWETVRHNQNLCDELVFELKQSSDIRYVSISTQYHLGNQAQAVMVEGFDTISKQWQQIVPKVDLEGHAIKHIRSDRAPARYDKIKVSMYPDGGLTRLGLFSEEGLPGSEKFQFLPWDKTKSVPFKESIAHSKKPLTPKYSTSDALIQTRWLALKPGDEVDLASLAFGGKILSASNEHYGPAAQIISPYPPLNMFDGFESARSRIKDHFEEVVIGLGRSAPIHRIEVDFTYFKNNNPLALSLQGFSKNGWVSLVDKVLVKAYAGNKIIFPINFPEDLEKIKVTVFPDGGMNRVHVFSRR